MTISFDFNCSEIAENLQQEKQGSCSLSINSELHQTQINSSHAHHYIEAFANNYS